MRRWWKASAAALALLSAGATGKITASHVDLAVILELIHIATLVHDDIMDGAELRRDQASANAKWGNAITVLLGDCLFAHALRLSTNFSNSDICRRIADAATEVCSGEIIQTQRRHDLKLSTADYYRIIEMKTAALFTAACELGAFISEASPTVIGSLKTYGTKLGVAYQIYDDILDLAGNEDESGKTLGTDLQRESSLSPFSSCSSLEKTWANSARFFSMKIVNAPKPSPRCFVRQARLRLLKKLPNDSLGNA